MAGAPGARDGGPQMEFDADDELPGAAGEVADDYPEVWAAYQRLGEACANAGPLDEGTIRLIKVALAMGAGSEGAVHSHVRRALDEGIDPESLRHVSILGITTLGFPRAMAALTWVDDILDED